MEKKKFFGGEGSAARSCQTDQNTNPYIISCVLIIIDVLARSPKEFPFYHLSSAYPPIFHGLWNAFHQSNSEIRIFTPFLVCELFGLLLIFVYIVIIAIRFISLFSSFFTCCCSILSGSMLIHLFIFCYAVRLEFHLRLPFRRKLSHRFCYFIMLCSSNGVIIVKHSA